MRKKAVSNYTLNARDSIPPLSGKPTFDDQRPPPKIITYHKATKGYSPRKVRKMIEEQKNYEKECEIVEAQRELALFEAKQNPSKKRKIEIPNFPAKPNIDYGIVNSYRPPEETKFYDFKIPRDPLKQHHKHECNETCMARGCPCCNPEKFREIRSKTSCGIRDRDVNDLFETREQKEDKIVPYQIGNSYWNVLDETSIPERPQTSITERPKDRPQFSMLRTGPRPAGIPVVLDDFAASIKRGEEKFKREMAKKDDIAMQKREAVLRARSERSRAAYDERARKTRTLSALSGQSWAVNGTLSTSRKRSTRLRTIEPEENKTHKLTKDELEEIRRVKEYDDKLYEKYKSSKKPENELDRLIYQTGFKMNVH